MSMCNIIEDPDRQFMRLRRCVETSPRVNLLSVIIIIQL